MVRFPFDPIRCGPKRRSPIVTEPMPSLSRLSPSDSALPRRIAVTLAALAVFQATRWIALPGVDMTALPALGGLERVSLGSLGLGPWLTAVILAEFAMLVWPRLRALTGDAPSAIPGNGGIVVGALILAGLQGAGLANALEDVAGVVRDPGAPFRLGVALSFVATTAFYVWLARLVDRHGLRHGFWILLAAPHAWSVAAVLASGEATAIQIAALAGFLALCAAVLGWLSRAAPALTHGDEALFAIVLGHAAANWILGGAILALWLATGDSNLAQTPGFMSSALLLPLVTLPAIALLRGRSLALAQGLPFDVKRCGLLALALGGLTGVGVLLMAFGLVSNARALLLLAAAGTLVALEIRAAAPLSPMPQDSQSGA